MRRTHVAVSLVFTVLAGALSAAPGLAGEGSQAARSPGSEETPEAAKRTPGDLGDGAGLWVEGEVLVQFKRGVKRDVARAVHAARGASVKASIRGLGPRIEHVRLAPGIAVADAVRSYGRDPRVALVEPNLKYRLQDHMPPPPANPNDTSWTHLWGLKNTGQPHNISDPLPPTMSGTDDADIDADEAWLTEDGFSNPTVVAVLDSGVDITHPDLDGNLWRNPDENPNNNRDDDGNGCKDDIHGRAFGYPNCRNLSDNEGHGTHVAGTIAAEGHNATGVVGVCPRCQVMVLKFDLTLAAELQAYAYARDKRAQVINGSFGSFIWSRLERNAIKRLNNAGILTVFAAGNAQLDNDMGLAGRFGLSPLFPASYTLPNIISVAASNHHDEYGYFTGCNAPRSVGGDGRPKKRCSFSNVGHDSVDVAAPGVDIRSTLPSNSYDEFNGTSMAAPHVAGVAGLVLSDDPALTPVLIKNKIMNGAERKATLRTFYSLSLSGGNATGLFTRTSGRLDAAKALTASTINATPKTDGNVDGALGIARSRRGRVAYPHDINDVYKKRLQKGKRYRAILRVGTKDLDLWIWGPGTQEIWQFESGCYGFAGPCRLIAAGTNPKGKNEVLVFRARRSAVHIFQVSAWLKNAGNYRLIVRPA